MNWAGAAKRVVRGIWRRRRKIAADAGKSPSRGHLSTAEYKWLSELFLELIVGLDGWCFSFFDIWAMSTRT